MDLSIFNGFFFNLVSMRYLSILVTFSFVKAAWCSMSFVLSGKVWHNQLENNFLWSRDSGTRGVVTNIIIFLFNCFRFSLV